MNNHDIEAFVTILLDPIPYPELNMRKFEDYWHGSETVVPQHELAAKYMQLNKAIPKLVVYILFKRVFGNPIKAANGQLGYALSFVI